jgi:hypothetical protein
VLRHDESDTNTVYVRSLVDGAESKHPVIDCHICPVGEMEAKRIARIDQKQFLVSRVVAYRGDPQLRTTMEYLVNYEDGDELWRPHTEDITLTEAWKEFVSGKPRLTGLTMSAEDQRKRVAEINKRKIVFGDGEILNKNTKVYMDMRAWGHEWYGQLTLPDLHKKTFIVQCNFTGVAKKGTKIDLQCSLLTGNKKFEMPHIFLVDECIWKYDPEKHVLVDRQFIEKYPEVLLDAYTKTVRTRSKRGDTALSLMNFCPIF